MAGSSLKAALSANFIIGVIKTIVGFFTGSAAMISEAYHSFADTFNQILLLIGVNRSKKEPDIEHPFGYKKVQFFWAFVVAVLIFGVSGGLALFEGIEIILHPSDHEFHPEYFPWQIAVLSVAIILESFALKTAINEAQAYQKKVKSEKLLEAVEEMQDPVLLSLLVEDSLALAGLIIALIGSIITFVTENPTWDGITAISIGIVLMIGGILLARENKRYLIGVSVSTRIKSQIKDMIENFEGVVQLNSMKTMILGPDDMLLALEVTFETYVIESDNGVADEIDKLEIELCKLVPKLTPNKIFIESQVPKIISEEQ